MAETFTRIAVIGAVTLWGAKNRFKPVVTDKFAYEAAAYRLDRMLAIWLVPVTVIRELDQRGLLPAVG